MNKTNYFYIDESGGLSNNSKLFIHGCIKTDNPQTIRSALENLKQQLLDNLYYEEFCERILKEGFHATENNMDMRADVYKLLPLLDYRSYFVLLNKETIFFQNLRESMEVHEIFAYSLRKLLMNRIERNKGDKNIFLFETIKLKKRSLLSILTDIFDSLGKSHDCEFHIVGKEEENMGVIDYLNFIFYHILSEESPSPRMQNNFGLVAPKIGVINLLHNNVYLSRKKKLEHQINITNLMNEFDG